jgi:hypothetical protein
LLLQISKFHNASFDGLERADFVENSMEYEDFSSMLIPSCEERHGSQVGHEGDTSLVIGRHRWDVDHRFLHGDPIDDTNSVSMMEENLIWHTPLPISFEGHLMKHQNDIPSPKFDNIGQLKWLKYVEQML